MTVSSHMQKDCRFDISLVIRLTQTACVADLTSSIAGYFQTLSSSIFQFAWIII